MKTQKIFSIIVLVAICIVTGELKICAGSLENKNHMLSLAETNDYIVKTFMRIIDQMLMLK